MARRTFRLSTHAVAFAALCMVAIGARAASAQTPTPTDIGNLGMTGTGVTAAAGDYVVGWSLPGNAVDVWGNQVPHAFVWSASTNAMVDIGALLTGAARSSAMAVNSHGEVAGIYYVPDYSSAGGFYWSQATGVVLIGAVSGSNGGSIKINENGVVASVDPTGHVFRWTRTGGAQDLGATGNDTYVTGINVRGDVIGNSGADAFIAYGTATSLTVVTSPGLTAPPPPWGGINTGGVDVRFNAINDNGVVVGTYFDFGYIYDGYDISQGGFYSAQVHNSHAFKWTATSGFTDLGNFGASYLTSHSPATFWASANAINNAGTIVGVASLPTGYYGAFVYDPGTGHLSQLASPNVGDNGDSATGINDEGIIVGYGNQTVTALMWQNGVPVVLTPSFARQYPGAPVIGGSRIAGNGFDNNWGAHGWTMALASAPPADTVPPAITVPGNLSAEATGPTGAAMTYAASATDGKDGSVAVNCAPASGSTFALGTTTVHCSASDAAGNTASASFTVTVVDTTAPSLSLPSSIAADATSASGAAVSFTASASDLVSGGVAVTCAPASGSTFALGTTTVNCSASDAAGNTATGAFSVTVADHTAPALTALLVNISRGGDDDSSQFFQVRLSATDAIGVTVLTAELNGIRVTDGQIVQLQIKSGPQSSKREDGKLQIKAPSFLLVATAKDAAGNTTTLTGTAVFNKNGKNDDDKKSEKKDDDKKGDKKGEGRKGGDR